jgi:hypothetical protein
MNCVARQVNMSFYRAKYMTYIIRLVGGLTL